MKRNAAWSHPLVLLAYFLPLLAACFAFQQPVYLFLTIALALAANGAFAPRPMGRHVLVALAVGLAVGLFYASFHHFGVTVLAYTRRGNPITAEVLLYSASLTVRATGGVLWLAAASALFTTDKVLALLGWLHPKLGLYGAVLLRLTPRARDAYRQMTLAARSLGRHRGVRPVLRRWSMLLTWVIDRLGETSRAMACRGGTLKGRTYFYPAPLEDAHRLQLLLDALCLGGLLFAHLLDQTRIWYRPRWFCPAPTGVSCLFYGMYVVYGLSLPVMYWSIRGRLALGRRSVHEKT